MNNDIPEGYVLVPVEPTEAMRKAGKRQCKLWAADYDAANDIYKAMINAIGEDE